MTSTTAASTVNQVPRSAHSTVAPNRPNVLLRPGNNDGNARPSNAQMTPAMAFNIKNNDNVTITIARWFDGSNGRISTRSITAAPIADRNMAITTATAPGMSNALAIA